MKSLLEAGKWFIQQYVLCEFPGGDIVTEYNPMGVSKDNVTLANYCKGIFIPGMSMYEGCLITITLDLVHVSNICSLFSTFIPNILQEWTVDFSKT